eukprot:2977105-Alexandrium_andersonii.AAC.1
MRGPRRAIHQHRPSRSRQQPTDTACAKQPRLRQEPRRGRPDRPTTAESGAGGRQASRPQAPRATDRR